MINAIISLIQNAALLLAMMVVFDLVINQRLIEKHWWLKIPEGIILGGLCIGLMNSAYRLETGVIFDLRSVLLSLSGLFLGPISTVVTMAIAAFYRSWQDGVGASTGVWVILVTGSIGILWGHFRQGRLEYITVQELFGFGIVVHVVMLTLMLTLPAGVASRVLSGIALPVLVVYPMATILLGWLLANKLRRKNETDAIAESENLFYNLFDKHGAVKLIIDPQNGQIVNANEAAEKFYGWTRDELRLMRISDINLLSPKQLKGEMAAAKERNRIYFEFKHRKKDGAVRDVGVFSSPIKIGGKRVLHSIIHDITSRKKAEENTRRNAKRLQIVIDVLQHESDNVQDFLDYCLEKAIEVTASKIGYIYFYDEEKKQFTLNTWSREVMNECNVMNPQTVYELDKTGFWGEAVRQRKPMLINEFQAVNPLKNGYPEGHVHLTRFLTIPVLQKGRIVAVAGVGNKETDYDETDILELTLLMDAVWKSTENLKSEEILQQSEKRFLDVLHASPDAIMLMDSTLHFVDCNKAVLQMFGYTKPEEILGKAPYEVSPVRQPDGRDSEEKADEMYRLASEKGYHRFEWVHQRCNGEDFLAEVSITALVHQGQRILQTVCRDITKIKQAEVERQELLERVEKALVEIYVFNGETLKFEYANTRALRNMGFTQEEMKNLTPVDIKPDFSEAAFREMLRPLLDGTLSMLVFETKHSRKDGSCYPVEAHVLYSGGEDGGKFSAFILDITERKQAEAEREKLQSQLNQAQKMESVGRLAGGVAHDFNNMLGVILGHADILLDDMEPEHPFYEGLREIEKAGKRSADLTRQLLAFARKQTILPELINLNKSISSMLKMLKRLIGEDIDLKWLPQKDLWTVKLDPSQVDQILANLCVNARDAIGGVGNITIETANCTLHKNSSSDQPNFIPGEYVSLIVRDTGCGMDQDTVSNIFEPFYTSKQQGEGTGLGLSTVYGIVNQNNGFIQVDSEPGQGASFNLYFPKYISGANPQPDSAIKSHLKTGNETILIVEDESALLELATKFLERLGYTALPASSPKMALELFENHHTNIDLVITDVIMPEMNGKDLVDLLKDNHPELKFLFMSGYTANVISHHGVLDEDLFFIPKPFQLQTLASKIREVLDNS